MPAFTGRENFYVIVGSSAGALIGLQFVVITLFWRRLATKLSPLVVPYLCPASFEQST